MARTAARRTPALISLIALAAMAACSTGGQGISDGPYAPGVDHRKPAVDGVEVGNRLMAAGEYELALDAYTRAALDQGMTTEILTGLGTANLGLGRLGQAERQLRRATEEAPDWPEAWNNLGVVLMERGEYPEAKIVFQRAYALDNGESDAIRDNLRFALAKLENPDNTVAQEQEYKLVRRGGSSVLLSRTQ